MTKDELIAWEKEVLESWDAKTPQDWLDGVKHFLVSKDGKADEEIWFSGVRVHQEKGRVIVYPIHGPYTHGEEVFEDKQKLDTFIEALKIARDRAFQ